MVDLRRMTSLLKGTPLRPQMGWGSWMVAATLSAVAEAAEDCRALLEGEEYVRDERLVLDLCGNGHCDPDGVVGRTACESHWSDDCSRQKESDENAA